MSNLLKEKHTLALLRARLEEKREREYWSYKQKAERGRKGESDSQK